MTTRSWGPVLIWRVGGGSPGSVLSTVVKGRWSGTRSRARRRTGRVRRRPPPPRAPRGADASARQAGSARCLVHGAGVLRTLIDAPRRITELAELEPGPAVDDAARPRLAQRGWVERKRDPGDGRGVL